MRLFCCDSWSLQKLFMVLPNFMDHNKINAQFLSWDAFKVGPLIHYIKRLKKNPSFSRLVNLKLVKMSLPIWIWLFHTKVSYRVGQIIWNTLSVRYAIIKEYHQYKLHNFIYSKTHIVYGSHSKIFTCFLSRHNKLEIPCLKSAWTQRTAAWVCKIGSEKIWSCIWIWGFTCEKPRETLRKPKKSLQCLNGQNHGLQTPNEAFFIKIPKFCWA